MRCGLEELPLLRPLGQKSGGWRNPSPTLGDPLFTPSASYHGHIYFSFPRPHHGLKAA